MPQTQPKAPKESYRMTLRDVASDRYLSTLNLPVDITTAEVERQLNAHLQGLLYEDDSLQGDDFACKVWKRAPIRVTAETDTLHIHVPLKIWAKFGYGFHPLGLDLSQYKSTDFELDVHFTTTFGVAPDWTAQTRTAMKGFDWVSKPTLKFGPVSIPIANIVGKIINKNQNTITNGIDEAVSKNLEIKKYVLQAWNTALQPFLISEKYRTWLQLTPRALLMTPFRITGNRIHATVGLQAVTQTSFGERPAARTVTDIPDLQRVPNVPTDFRVALVAQLTHAEARRLLADTLIGREFTFSEGRYRVEVTDVDLYGSEDRLIIKTTLRGSLNGVVYFRGTPYYDARQRLIELRDLDYDLDSRSLLLRTANWFLQGRFTRQLQEAFRFPVGDQIGLIQQQLQAALTNRVVRKGVTLNGSMQEISPEGVYLVPDNLLALVYAKGHVTLSVDGL